MEDRENVTAGVNKQSEIDDVTIDGKGGRVAGGRLWLVGGWALGGDKVARWQNWKRSVAELSSFKPKGPNKYPVDKEDWTQEIEQRAQQAAQAGEDHCALYSISCVLSSLPTGYRCK